ncbi:hypothetical protein HMPREF1402_01377 [Helicobacter pylori GAM121Aii]|nr:hypothetical protein HMPREF1402_01377 [Helicobacter pylori GAM121Aii]
MSDWFKHYKLCGRFKTTRYDCLSLTKVKTLFFTLYTSKTSGLMWHSLQPLYVPTKAWSLNLLSNGI